MRRFILRIIFLNYANTHVTHYIFILYSVGNICIKIIELLRNSIRLYRWTVIQSDEQISNCERPQSWNKQTNIGNDIHYNVDYV